MQATSHWRSFSISRQKAAWLSLYVLVIADWDQTLLGVWSKVQADTAQQTCQEVRDNDDEATLPSCTLQVS